MSMNSVPSGERTHIAFFGCRNVGKSSLVNAFCNQEVSIVSDVKGTTTDPVNKSMELLPLGPVVIIDTPGIDDEGELGELRVKKTRDVLKKTDIAILVCDANKGFCDADRELMELFSSERIPFVIACNKSDIISFDTVLTSPGGNSNMSEAILYVSAKNGAGINSLKETVAGLLQKQETKRTLIGDLSAPGDTVLLIVPIDKAAPKGRLILPQQQVIRDALDHGIMPLVCRDSELEEALDALSKKPALVITDSQVFKKVSSIVPGEIPLTSFSILMARYKGNLIPSVTGVQALEALNDGDRILISEGCTHHRQCGDIGSVKLPAMIKKYTGKDVDISLSSGHDFPEDLSGFRLVIHCGACMLSPREATVRYRTAAEQNIPITNYGIAIAHMTGILRRSIAMLPEIR